MTVVLSVTMETLTMMTLYGSMIVGSLPLHLLVIALHLSETEREEEIQLV